MDTLLYILLYCWSGQIRHFVQLLFGEFTYKLTVNDSRFNWWLILNRSPLSETVLFCPLNIILAVRHDVTQMQKKVFMWPQNRNKCAFIWPQNSNKCAFIWPQNSNKCAFIWPQNSNKCAFIWPQNTIQTFSAKRFGTKAKSLYSSFLSVVVTPYS